eukprot:jgi/Botrbrau1/5566/Bobra.0023s0049.1
MRSRHRRNMILIYTLTALSHTNVRGMEICHLSTGIEMTGQKLAFGSTQGFAVNDLVIGRGYEVRVSHPATIPARISLELSYPERNAFPLGSTDLRRRSLLDVDKLVFYAQQEEAKIWMRAERGSLHKDGVAAYPTHVHFNIKVEELVVGLPRDTFPVILMAAFLLLIVALTVTTWTDRVVPALVAWISCEAAQPEGGPQCKRRQSD